MSTRITFAAQGPQNTSRVRFFRRACREYRSFSRYFWEVHKQEIFFLSQNRPDFATVEYGGTFSFCRCLHSVGGDIRGGQVFSKIAWFSLCIWSSAWIISVYTAFTSMHWLVCRDPRRTARRCDTASALKCWYSWVSRSIWRCWFGIWTGTSDPQLTFQKFTSQLMIHIWIPEIH